MTLFKRSLFLFSFITVVVISFAFVNSGSENDSRYIENQIQNGISIELKDGKVFMRLNGHVANEQATLTIKNGSGLQLFSEEVEVLENQIFRVFDQKTFESGTYYVLLSAQNQTFESSFTI